MTGQNDQFAHSAGASLPIPCGSLGSIVATESEKMWSNNDIEGPCADLLCLLLHRQLKGPGSA